jgi:hypothetical protein
MPKHMSKAWPRSLIAHTGHSAAVYVWGRDLVVFSTCVRSWDCRTPGRSSFFIHGVDGGQECAGEKGVMGGEGGALAVRNGWRRFG